MTSIDFDNQRKTWGLGNLMCG